MRGTERGRTGHAAEARERLPAGLEIAGLTIGLPPGRDPSEAPPPAIAGLDLAVAPGERVGLLGEPGSGTAALALAVPGLLAPPLRVLGGTVRFGGQNLLALPPAALRRLRGRRIATVVRDPLTALDPGRTLGHQMLETLAAHRMARGREARARALAMLRAVGMDEPERSLRLRPGALEPTARARAVIALALVAEPALVVADEPGATLEPQARTETLALLAALCRDRGAALLLATADPAAAAQATERVAVLCAGHLVEEGPTRSVLAAPRHPYTAALLAGDGPTPAGPPPAEGCPFRARCERAYAGCYIERPDLEAATDAEGAEAGHGRRVACHLPLRPAG